DLAPWELPALYATSPAARFGHRLRARVLRDATRLIVCSRATAESAQRRLHVRADRVVVVPLAAAPAFGPEAAAPARVAALRARFGLPERYLVFAGRSDARKDLGTLFSALAALREGTPDSSREPWPPLIVLAGALGADESDVVGLARAAERRGVADLVRHIPRLSPAELASLEAGARAVVFPAISEGTGLVVQEALAVGTPVVASRVGPLPEFVGPAGIVVEPRDPERLAAALRVVWGGGRIHAQLVRAAQAVASSPRRTWREVASETRAVYAAAAVEGRPET
ncbi:MAG: glycosyltransferase, partial [Candidatus Limnocylindrales bacterium]